MKLTHLVGIAAAGAAVLLTQVAPATAGSVSSRQTVTPNALSSLCGYTSSQPTLAYGSTGTAVRQAQCELNWAYQNPRGALAVDGIFGTATKNATINFQKCVHLSADGIIGPDTWSELNYWVTNSHYACGP